MKKLIALAAFVAVIASFTSAQAENRKEHGEKAVQSQMESAAKGTKTSMNKSYMEITATDLNKMITDKKDVIIIDARAEKDYNEGHIEGATNLRPEQINKENMEKIASNKDTNIVFYCGGTTCNASEKGAKKAEEMGYKNIHRFTGGMTAWKESGYNIVM